MMEQLIAALSPMTIWWLAALVIFAVGIDRCGTQRTPLAADCSVSGGFRRASGTGGPLGQKGVPGQFCCDQRGSPYRAAGAGDRGDQQPPGVRGDPPGRRDLDRSFRERRGDPGRHHHYGQTDRRRQGLRRAGKGAGGGMNEV